jgi:outer membrane protein TolC
MIRTLLFTICLLTLAQDGRAQTLRPEEVLGQNRLVTLSEAVALALENNLGLQVRRLDPAVARERVRETWGVFEPNLVGRYDRQHLETPLASSVQSFFAGAITDRTTEDYFVSNGGLQGILPWGLSYSTGYTLQQLRSDSSFYALDPQYSSSWRSELRIPLLRGLYWSAPDLQVRRSRVFQDVSDEDFRTRLADSLLALEDAYWTLAASRALELAAIKSVETAEDLLEQTQVQYKVGVVAKVRVTEAEAGLAQRDFDLIVRSNLARAAQDALLTAILEPGLADYTSTYLKTEEPAFVPYEVNAEASLEKARAARPELERARKLVEVADLEQSFYRNQKLPALDVRASYANSGLAGSQKRPAGSPVTSPIPAINNNGTPADPTDDYPFYPTVPAPNLGFPSGRWGADDNFLEGDGDHSWGVLANLVVPIGNDSADARYVQSKIELRRAKTNLRLEEQSVTVSVRNAVRNLESAIDGVKAAQSARIAFAETLRAEQERLRLGDSTPHVVLQFDEDLRLAESNEIRALQIYRTAIAALERAQGTLLDTLGVNVVNERERGVGDF